MYVWGIFRMFTFTVKLGCVWCIVRVIYGIFRVFFGTLGYIFRTFIVYLEHYLPLESQHRRQEAFDDEQKNRNSQHE